jgi:hypothetical protein
MLTAMLAFVLSVASEPPIGTCDPVDGPPIRWSAEQRDEARDRVRVACRAMRASAATCAWLDAVGDRESAWRPSVRHVLGERENGLGVFGLSKRWHRDKWPGDPEPAFCSPEASVIVALAVVRRAQLLWDARNLIEVNAVFGGRFRCLTEGDQRECFIIRDRARDRDICARLELRGVDCRAPLPKRAGGRSVPVQERPAAAAELAAGWTERHEPAS